MPLGRNSQDDSRGASQRSTIVSIVLAVAVIAVVVVGSVYFVKHRSASVDAPDASTPGASAASSAPLPPPGPPACGEGDALLAAMSTRDKLAQLLMVGVTGADDARAVVAKDHVGGIMIGSWTDLTMMGDPLREIAASSGPLPLAVSTDEEGGRVSRLKSMIGVQPSARVLGQTASAQEVHDIALTRGQAMKALGITIDFAPVVDVSDQDDDTVIGDRSFSADPAKVTAYAGAYARGLLDAGITPVLKHFPGHGHASGDSHLGGVVTPPLSELMTNDLVPYRELAQLPGTTVMVGHMQVPGLTGADPASLSAPAYGLLRSGGYGGLPFNGVVFTDDISSMGAINQQYTVAQAALKALQAGADIALWITTDEVPGVLDALEAAVSEGGLDMKKVDDSVLRIAALKGKSPRCGG
ncbi:glycoside hydrolase family 3 N-terminal domain-containing protein [Mycolicibacterium hodleri]|uniref:beta-N-acetylhexosaminidase n=1 Tax=Mycolicibacterium hodleri TaxID=49897 RepID=A0A502DY29_9MYCO|nr:glycoside hydrolase family 3 N-terminal domain-containing protein [Mycolicibacterium hodleri]TPG29589.1 glycoside hydrolase family 3 protein [Mycolicibacterium hodleri]